MDLLRWLSLFCLCTWVTNSVFVDKHNCSVRWAFTHVNWGLLHIRLPDLVPYVVADVYQMLPDLVPYVVADVYQMNIKLLPK